MATFGLTMSAYSMFSTVKLTVNQFVLEDYGLGCAATGSQAP